MALEQVNNMHVHSLAEKDERIKSLLGELQEARGQLGEKKYGVAVDEAEYA